MWAQNYISINFNIPKPKNTEKIKAILKYLRQTADLSRFKNSNSNPNARHPSFADTDLVTPDDINK